MGWCWWEVLERETKDIERKSVVGVRQPPTSCDFETAHHDLLMICQELSQKYKSWKGQLVTPVNHVTLFGPKVASSGTNAPIRSTSLIGGAEISLIFQKWVKYQHFHFDCIWFFLWCKFLIIRPEILQKCTHPKLWYSPRIPSWRPGPSIFKLSRTNTIYWKRRFWQASFFLNYLFNSNFTIS